MVKINLNKWWFFLVLLIIFFLPPLTEVPFDSRYTNRVVVEVLQNPFIYKFEILYGLIKVIFLVLVTCLISSKFRVERAFNYFVVILLIGIALFQNSAITSSYGIAVLPGNLILMAIIAIFWFNQIHTAEGTKIKNRIGYSKYWLIGLALLAYWFPVDATGKYPNFTLNELLFNESMVTGCMLMPVILVVAILYFNKINLTTLKVTGFIGLLFGVINMIVWFILNRELWWMGVLHLPLLVISFYVFIMAGKELKHELKQ